MNKKKLDKIRNMVKLECESSGSEYNWFFDGHLLAVEKNAEFLLNKLPNADKEIVMLGVWLHDLQRFRFLKGDHQKVGAQEAEKVLKKFNYNKDIIEKVKRLIKCHSCRDVIPGTIEQKILASADAMASYHNNFFLQVARMKRGENLSEFKKWALEKLNRNYNNKIFFSFAKKHIKERHKVLKAFFELI